MKKNKFKKLITILVISFIFTILISAKSKPFKFSLNKKFENLMFVYLGFDEQENIVIFYIKKLSKENTVIEYINYTPDKSIIISEMTIDNNALTLLDFNSKVYSNIDGNNIYKIVYTYKIKNDIDRKTISGLSTSYKYESTPPETSKKEIKINYKILPGFLFPIASDFWYSLFFFNLNTKSVKINNFYYFISSKSYIKSLKKIEYKKFNLDNKNSNIDKNHSNLNNKKKEEENNIPDKKNILNLIKNQNKSINNSLIFYLKNFDQNTVDIKNIEKKYFELKASGMYQLYIPELKFTLFNLKYPILYEWEISTQAGYQHKKLAFIKKIPDNIWNNFLENIIESTNEKNINKFKLIMELIDYTF